MRLQGNGKIETNDSLNRLVVQNGINMSRVYFKIDCSRN